MTNRAVHFTAIKVHHVLGIEHGEGFELSNLSPGVNLIHGPNGSGKSTTAHVIQELLWPGRAGLGRSTATGRFCDDGREWQVDIDAGHFQAACDGQPGTVPELGPPENSHRYHVALHELIGDDNADFAKVIADASQGGYDLETAAQGLGFTERPSSPRKQFTRLKDSRCAVEEAGRNQQNIEQDFGRLPEFREQRDQAAAAESSIDLLQKAQDFQHAVGEYRRIETKLDALHEGVAKLRGDEREELNRLAGRREKLDEDMKAEREKVEGAERELDKLGLPDEGVDEEVLLNLRSWQRKLGRVESDLVQQRLQRSKAVAEAKKARERLGEHLTDEQLASIETVEVSELSIFARQSDQVRAQQKVVEERRRWLDREEPEEVQELDERQIRDGITALARWFASPTPAAKPEAPLWWPIVIAATFITVLGIILALVYHWAWIMVVLPAGCVTLWDWWLRQSHLGVGTADPQAVHQQSYEATGLEPPRAWEVTAVSEVLRNLVHLAELRAQEDRRLEQLSNLVDEADAVNQRRGILDQRRRELENRLGLCTEVADEWLPLLIDNIGSWQHRSDEAVGAEQILQKLERIHKTLLDRILEATRPYGYDRIDSADLAAQWLEDLADRQARYRTAIAERRDGKRRIKVSIEPEIQEVVNWRQNIFNRLGLDESDEPIIDDWLADRPDYLDLKKELVEAETIRNDRRQALAEHEDLLKLDPANIQEKIDQCRKIADKRDKLSERIAGIEQDIDRAKAGHELSDALDVRYAAAAELAEARDKSGAAVVGALLTKWVRTVAIERSRPQVFRRANELVIRFTRGTLQLELDDHASPPEFRARQGSTPPRPVDQLSVGERVQLLIAVRVAFLEQDEPTRLPLLLDEALGTSDDDRAGVIIDTVIEIAREGRQVFYFTAQHDEVGKWIARLNESDTTYKVIDLAQIRQLGNATAPLQIASVDEPQPPAPDGMSHVEYGRILGVPNINPAVENLDGLHPWHLVDDVDLLHQLLCGQITSWSQLRTLLEHDGAGLVEADDEQIRGIAAVAKAVEAASQAWRIGRGKRVDRRALQDSDCVSDRFINELTDLAKRVDGDAKAHIEALERGEVSGWRSKNIERLREFFEDNGFLPADEPLQPEEIRVHVLAAVADDLRECRLDVMLVNRIVGSLPASAAQQRHAAEGDSRHS